MRPPAPRFVPAVFRGGPAGTDGRRRAGILARCLAGGLVAWGVGAGMVRAAEQPGGPVAQPGPPRLPAGIQMPGKSFSGPLPPLTASQAALRDALQRDVVRLAGGIGERHTRRAGNYALAAEWIQRALATAGYQVHRQTFAVGRQECVNLEVARQGTTAAAEIVVLGAHYDTASGTPGANDNATGVAALLALARRFAAAQPPRTLRFVFFANEEMPFFKTANMGSLIYARRCRARDERIVGMISLETIGYYTDTPNSQKYPPPFDWYYPTTGNFISFVGNVKSRSLVEQCVASFRREARFPSEGGAVPAGVDGVSWSDHWSFWQVGYPALMVTDTAPFRYPHYHRATDTPDKVDYARMARVVEGIEAVVRQLVHLQPRQAEP